MSCSENSSMYTSFNNLLVWKKKKLDLLMASVTRLNTSISSWKMHKHTKNEDIFHAWANFMTETILLFLESRLLQKKSCSFFGYLHKKEVGKMLSSLKKLSYDADFTGFLVT